MPSHEDVMAAMDEPHAVNEVSKSGRPRQILQTSLIPKEKPKKQARKKPVKKSGIDMSEMRQSLNEITFNPTRTRSSQGGAKQKSNIFLSR